ncbi:MAG: hypothetical protein HYY17_07665 [Planctomycetes bacterium]|nr:hypothetical protein [Planctomycetota bacterium]
MARRNLFLGQLALERSLVSREQLAECLDEQASASAVRPLGRILVSRGLVTESQLTDLIDEQLRRNRPRSRYAATHRDDCRIGWLLLRAGRLTPQEVNEALRAQQDLAERGVVKKLGEILVDCGRLTPEEVREFLARQRKQRASRSKTRSRRR